MGKLEWKLDFGTYKAKSQRLATHNKNVH